MAKLYPPIIEGTIPAFWGDSITIPFSMNRGISKTQVGGFALKAKTVQSSSYLFTLETYDINTFNVVFRRHYPGYTPGVWMQIQRKDEILADLVETDAPIYHISKKYGFSSSSHMGEYCKKYLGDTPTRVRSKFRKKKR